MPQPVVGSAPARWGRFDPPCLLLLELQALVRVAGGGLLSGEAVGGPPVVFAVESAVRERADARFVREGPDA